MLLSSLYLRATPPLAHPGFRAGVTLPDTPGSRTAIVRRFPCASLLAHPLQRPRSGFRFQLGSRVASRWPRAPARMSDSSSSLSLAVPPQRVPLECASVPGVQRRSRASSAAPPWIPSPASPPRGRNASAGRRGAPHPATSPTCLPIAVPSASPTPFRHSIASIGDDPSSTPDRTSLRPQHLRGIRSARGRAGPGGWAGSVSQGPARASQALRRHVARIRAAQPMQPRTRAPALPRPARLRNRRIASTPIGSRTACQHPAPHLTDDSSRLSQRTLRPSAGRADDLRARGGPSGDRPSGPPLRDAAHGLGPRHDRYRATGHLRCRPGAPTGLPTARVFLSKRKRAAGALGMIQREPCALRAPAHRQTPWRPRVSRLRAADAARSRPRPLQVRLRNTRDRDVPRRPERTSEAAAVSHCAGTASANGASAMANGTSSMPANPPIAVGALDHSPRTPDALHACCMDRTRVVRGPARPPPAARRRFGPVPRPAATPPRNAGQSRGRHREGGGKTVTDPLALPLQHRETDRRSREVLELPSGCLPLRNPSTRTVRIGTLPIASSACATSARGNRSCAPCAMRAAARSRPSRHPFIRYRRDSGISRPSPRGASGGPSRIRSRRRPFAMRSRSNRVRRSRPADAVPVRMQTRRRPRPLPAGSCCGCVLSSFLHLRHAGTRARPAAAPARQPRNTSLPCLEKLDARAALSFFLSPFSGLDRSVPPQLRTDGGGARITASAQFRSMPRAVATIWPAACAACIAPSGAPTWSLFPVRDCANLLFEPDRPARDRLRVLYSALDRRDSSNSPMWAVR